MKETMARAAGMLGAGMLCLLAAGCGPKMSGQDFEKEEQQAQQPAKQEDASSKEEEQREDSKEESSERESENPPENPLWQDEDLPDPSGGGKDGPPDAELNPPVRRS